VQFFSWQGTVSLPNGHCVLALHVLVSPRFLPPRVQGQPLPGTARYRTLHVRGYCSGEVGLGSGLAPTMRRTGRTPRSPVRWNDFFATCIRAFKTAPVRTPRCWLTTRGPGTVRATLSPRRRADSFLPWSHTPVPGRGSSPLFCSGRGPPGNRAVRARLLRIVCLDPILPFSNPPADAPAGIGFPARRPGRGAED
jgi:hypothetical protein